MTSTPVTILELRSSLDSDRPSGTILQFGQLALCAGSGDPGLYFLDTDNAVRKIGPTAYGTTPPNAIYIGASGNSVGEAWTDSSPRNYYKVWDGTTWIKVSAGFSDTSTLASGAILASGALLASGAYLASGAIQASGAILASGALFANAAIQASGAILASGAIQSETSNLASGAVLASGALFSNTSTLASGAVYASGASSIATVVASGLPNPTAIESGVAYLQLESSGTYPSGLYIRAGSDWYFI
tara:strand:+ start:7079 stop:7813 length:735 start_codon:yes stop_codon:yes gene_type:complete